MASLYHVGLTISDLERSLAFYQEAVGMTLEYRSAVATEAFAQGIGKFVEIHRGVLVAIGVDIWDRHIGDLIRSGRVPSNAAKVSH